MPVGEEDTKQPEAVSRSAPPAVSGVMSLGTEGHVAMIDPVAADFLGVMPGTARGLTLEEILTPGVEREALTQAIRAPLTAREPEVTRELPFRGRRLRVTSRRHPLSSGRLALSVILADISGQH